MIRESVYNKDMNTMIRKRRPGRPWTQRRDIENALEHLGGLRQILLSMDARGTTYTGMAEELYRLTNVRVSHMTVYNWLREFASQQA